MRSPEPSTVAQSLYPLTLLYDGRCEELQYELNALRPIDTLGRLVFVDVSDAGFDAAAYGKSLDDLEAEIHGVHPDGRMLCGDGVLQLAYAAVGKTWMSPLQKSYGIKPCFQAVRWVFAQHRHLVTRHPIAWLSMGIQASGRPHQARPAQSLPCRLEVVPEVDASLALVSGVPVLNDVVDAELPCMQT